MARSRKVKERTPIKADMGSWNFVKSEMRNKTIHWLCVCDCERSVQWKLPCRITADSICFHCSADRRSQTYKAGKQASQDNAVVEDEPIVEKVAPEGQLSLETLKKNFERASPEVKQLCREAADILNAAYKTPVQDEPQVPFDSTEKQWLSQIEFFLETITDIVGKLKEAQIKKGK